MEYSLLTPTDAKQIRELRIVNNTGQGNDSLKVVLSLEREGTENCVTITFDGVQELCIRNLRAGSLLGPLKIRDLSDRQLEGIRYQVMDYEEESLTLLCNDILKNETEAV